jgi:hypothetical protein
MCPEQLKHILDGTVEKCGSSKLNDGRAGRASCGSDGTK